jgi:signal peptidase I
MFVVFLLSASILMADRAESFFLASPGPISRTGSRNAVIRSSPNYPSSMRSSRLSSSSSSSANVMMDEEPPPISSTSLSFYFLAQSSNVLNLTFPSYLELMNCRVGECITSETFQCGNNNNTATFCVKLYPRGGGHRTSSSSSSTSSSLGQPQQTQQKEQGFGMSYKVLPMFGNSDNKDFQNQRVGMYLQYLGAGDDSSSTSTTRSSSSSIIDATFALRLKGNQQVRRKFDVEWRAGMRFVPPDQPTDLSKGRANDFGAHLMQTPLLQEFMGVSPDNELDATPLVANVEITIHDTAKELMVGGPSDITTESDIDCNVDDDEETSTPASFFGALVGNDIRIPLGSNKGHQQQHDGKRVRVGKVVVPILNKLSQRAKMFEQGAYPGVEYRILRILNPSSGVERFTSCPGCDYELKPIYPLVAQLERPWPVRVNEADIPRLYTPNMYNAVSALGALVTAITGLTTAFVVSQAVSLFFIPSRSMDPTLHVGDVLLVDKLSPRVFKNQKPGDIVLFSPPSELRDIVAVNGGKLTSRDLFVKRVAAESGDTVAVESTGRVKINGQPAPGRRDLCEAEPLRLIEKYIKQSKKEQILHKGEFFVMGDCSSVSIDSRVWGPLQSSEVVGKPILRLWPLEQFGPLPSLQPLTTATEGQWQE